MENTIIGKTIVHHTEEHVKDLCKTCYHNNRVKTDEGHFCVPGQKVLEKDRISRMAMCCYYSKKTLWDLFKEKNTYDINIYSHMKDQADRHTLKTRRVRVFPFFTIKIEKGKPFDEINHRIEYRIYNF